MFFKSKKHLLVNQNTTEIKQDASIFKLNIFKLHQAIIPWTMYMKTLKSLEKVAHYTLHNQKLFSAYMPRLMSK